MDGLFHNSFPLRMARWTRTHSHPVMLGYRNERRLDTASTRNHHGGHPINPPPPGSTTHTSQHRVDALDQVRLVLTGRDPRPKSARVRQDPHQHQSFRLPRGIRKLHPVPSAFLTRWMINNGGGTALGARTGATKRPQPTIADLPHESRIALQRSQSHHLIEQHRRPNMRIIRQRLTHIRLEQTNGSGSLADL